MTESICVSCNMCCDGTLFGFLEISADELGPLGPKVQTRDVEGTFSLVLGCPNLGETGACGIYADRPAKCRAYNCNVIKRMEAGQLDRARADRIVSQAKTLRDMTMTALLAEVPEAYMPKDRPNPRRLMNALHQAKLDGAGISEAGYDYAALLYNLHRVLMEQEFQKNAES